LSHSSKIVSLRMARDRFDRLVAVADARHCRPSDVIRSAIDAYLGGASVLTASQLRLARIGEFSSSPSTSSSVSNFPNSATASSRKPTSAWSSIMARNDIRTDGRAIPLTHHSARGRVQRNSGNFTRGSQLLTHELLMWFSGAKLPILMWFFLFAPPGS
jgi:hypothetical protein